MRGSVLVFVIIFLMACGSTPTPNVVPRVTPDADSPQTLKLTTPSPTAVAASPSAAKVTRSPSGGAAVQGVSATGSPGAYTFQVTVSSPDTGCDEYADWWEVLSAEGELLYRRVLLHSHVEEQPFTRSGGPVPAQPEQELMVRAHLNTTGYGTATMRGTIAGGFTLTETTPDFAPGVAALPPQPNNCAF